MLPSQLPIEAVACVARESVRWCDLRLGMNHLVRAEFEQLACSSLVDECSGTAGKLNCILDGVDCRFGVPWSGRGRHRQTLAMQTQGDQLAAAVAAAGGGGGGGAVRAATKFSIHAEQQ